jgi:hypothetical protein
MLTLMLTWTCTRLLQLTAISSPAPDRRRGLGHDDAFNHPDNRPQWSKLRLSQENNDGRTSPQMPGVATLLLLGPADHSATDYVERSYASRKLSIMIGHETGTGFDLYGRTMTRHTSRFIRGNPA